LAVFPTINNWNKLVFENSSASRIYYTYNESGHASNKRVKKTTIGWKSYGNTIISPIKEPVTLGGKFISHVAPHTGTGIFAAGDIIGDVWYGKKFDLGVDIGSVIASEGIGFGVNKILGTAIIAALLPEIGVSASAVVISIISGIVIDTISNRIKESH
jgi:hypothetical protein